MEVNSLMSSQLMELQQTVQMSVMQNALNLNTTTAIELLNELPQQQTAPTHPYKGSIIDISI
ncbi:putative motility protein [Lysinibacillus sp. A4]|uniref:putative motility protein n=1 Tax=unclassified Lysinibacillus TaxID=2636778 RepID=UPI001ED9E65E|nr:MULTISPECIES: putative motility protein [unclassified Lysinibacillus]MCS5501762.1 putative motility protein [Lysinibacillus sp. A4]UKJ45779.1 putative motility protein [Lysinibacillus sp. ACHW1.5]WGT39211.1 putative motility protein [Lysinibacillus sp. 1 U-2021]